MEDRAVSLNAVKETLCSMCDEWRCNENCSKKREFDKLPSVLQTKTGHWITKGMESLYGNRCSVCYKIQAGGFQRTPYCPHCGAYMKGDKNG